ncbi:MAG: EAL domain-containing protein [Lachnospiraceae bacterium]|nr:EAL domain-containing protein [Lachnospiraceae bacterium]
MTNFVEVIQHTSYFQAAFLITFCSAIYILIQKRFLRLQNRLFFALLLNVMFTSLMAVAIYIIRHTGEPSLLNRVTVEMLTFLYFLLHALLAPILCYYIIEVCGRGSRLKQQWRTVLLVPVVFTEALVLVNPLFHFVYRINDDLSMTRQWGETFIYLAAGFYIAYGVGNFFLFWRTINQRRRFALLLFFGFAMSGIVIQLFVQELYVELFTEALGLLGVMITVENEDDRIDPGSGAFNRSAFLLDIESLLHGGQPFEVICIRVKNSEVYERVTGSSNTEIVMKTVAAYFRETMPEAGIYRTNPFSFFLVTRDGDESRGINTAEAVSDRFHTTWICQDSEIYLEALIMCTEVPSEFKSVADILLMSDSPMDRAEEKQILSGRELGFLLRRVDVLRALQRGFEEHSFEVVYQPVYTKSGHTIVSAEALIRMRDPELGEITPDEFLTVAEQKGFIDAIGDFVVEEVCLFLSSGIPEEMGIAYISINLSVVQIMRSGFVKHIENRVAEYNVRPQLINFEITESAAVRDHDLLAASLAELKEYGFLCTIDDYGTGNSNFYSAFNLEFDSIKFDITTLWGAQKSEIGRIILEKSVSLMREMGKLVTVEGVETAEQIELLEKMPIDYLQGFYFSRPISQNEFIGVLRATELARMEEQRALAANEAKSNFLANMSHEIRTPINAVLGMDEMILRECKDEKILEYAQNIAGAGRTLLSIINDILDFSKIEAGSMEIVNGEYELSSVLNDVYNMIQIKAQQKELKFNLQIDEQLPNKLFGDEMRLRQILVNILNNAVKYTAHGSVSLRIDGRLKQSDLIELVASISDTGIGIKEEDLDKLFDKFRRLDLEQNRSEEGSGLGLAITHNLLELMHGDISVQSVYGEGSTFTVTVPQHIVNSEPIGDFRKRFLTYSKNLLKYHETFRAPAGIILVVDDTPMNHTVVIELLKQTGLKIDSAKDGRECLEMQRKKKYDIIFLDYRMPGMNGIETLSAMRADEESLNLDTPVVALTANAVSGARENFIRNGFTDYLTKPIDGNHLETMLIKYLPKDKVEVLKTEKPENEIPVIPGLDTRAGIKRCGSEDGYMNVLKVFYGSIDNDAINIETAYRDENWEDYTTYVHSLKSTSRIIGAEELSRMAESLEAAGNDRDVEAIREGTGDLLEMYREFNEVLGVFFNEKADNKPELPPGKLIDAYRAIYEFSGSMDYDNVMFVLDSLEEYRIPGEDRQIVERIRDLVSRLKWEKLTRELKQLI